MTRRILWLAPLAPCVLVISLLFGSTSAAEPTAPVATPVARMHLPLILKPAGSSLACPINSTNSYAQGSAYQRDNDNPVRPANQHADKNLALRGYVANNDAGVRHELVDYGAGEPNQPPQFATLFSPDRVPALVGFYRVHYWNWSPSPNPGSQGAPLTRWPVTALGLRVTPGETLRVPTSAYDIGQGFEVIVLHADERRVALHYGRGDGVMPGYTVHIEGLCTDPKLLALYNQLNAANGPRYVFPASQYPLPVLPAGQPIGLARGSEVVVAVVDSGEFMDPRSCNEWWQIRPGYAGTCPPHESSALPE